MLCGGTVAVLLFALFFRGIRLTFRAGMKCLVDPHTLERPSTLNTCMSFSRGQRILSASVWLRILLLFMAIDTHLSNFFLLSIVISLCTRQISILATYADLHSPCQLYTAVINTTKDSQYGSTRRIQRGSHPTSPSICQGLHPPCQEMHQARS